LENNSNFIHIEYDTNLNLKIEETKHSHVILDAVHFDTERLMMTLGYYTKFGYDITVVYMKTSKDICKQNIIKRQRYTIDIDGLHVFYDFKSLMTKFKFNVVQITDYKLDFDRSICVNNVYLFQNICKLSRLYENTGARNIVQNASW
jgi:hypothetical protein